jgi:hypothetical protein
MSTLRAYLSRRVKPCGVLALALTLPLGSAAYPFKRRTSLASFKPCLNRRLRPRHRGRSAINLTPEWSSQRSEWQFNRDL